MSALITPSPLAISGEAKAVVAGKLHRIVKEVTRGMLLRRRVLAVAACSK